MTGFGASAPAKDLFKHFGITPEAVVKAAEKRLRLSIPLAARLIGRQMRCRGVERNCKKG